MAICPQIRKLYHPIQPSIKQSDDHVTYQEFLPVVELRDEPWGDRHFAIIDPNGVAIDLVTYTAPEEE